MLAPTVTLSTAQLTLLCPSSAALVGESSQSSGQSGGDHHFDNIVYKVAHEAPGAHGEGGRFDEEAMMPDHPYR